MIMHQLDARVRKMKSVLYSLIVRKRVPVSSIKTAPEGSSDFVPFENGAFWATEKGDNWQDFRFSVTVPEDFYGQTRLIEDTSANKPGRGDGQIVAWVNGRITQAFDNEHKELILQDQARAGEKFDLFLQAYHKTGSSGAGIQIPRMALFVCDTMDDVRALFYDIDVPHCACLLEPVGEREREMTFQVLSDALNLVDLREPYSEAFHASIAAARAFLKENYYDKIASVAPEAVAECVGHSHLDVAYRWDLHQTRHKAIRTFSTMLELLKRYPEFRFMSSQPQLYEFVKEDEPALYERIKEAVKDGRWEPEGGMWVEADCNLSGGEALVRQFLYGNEFFETEFGRRSRILWLPDVFGYSAALPQILKKSGINYFMTSKLSWSEYNETPYDTFMWKGIDGSEVLSHFTPARNYSAVGSGEESSYYTTYNATVTPDMVRGGWARFQQKGVDNHYLMCVGHGDGGGGTTERMLENARRMAGPVVNCPAVRYTDTLSFFENLEKRVSGNKRLPKWSGELYLEYHRGTYTAQGKNKKKNRKLEIALRDVEFWLTYAGLPYPQDELRDIWRNMLTLQFHDVLPGSGIHKVYTDSDEIYENLFERVAKIKKQAIDAVTGNLAGDIAVTNTLSETRSDIVRFTAPEGVCALKNEKGEIFPAQKTGEDSYIAYLKNLPPMSVNAFRFVYGTEEKSGLTLTESGFETPYFMGSFDASFRITSLFDKEENRELTKEGKALNAIVYYENRPHFRDAWDINIYYDERFWNVEDVSEVRIESVGPVCATIAVTWKVSKSTVTERYTFYKDLKRVDFDADIDWQEPHGLMKAHFPMDIFYNAAQFDIQYGNVTRATHKNTSWDTARFEVCAHKWADVSEASYGASILNDCKYGYSVDENGMALTLLKSSTDPDPVADIGRHVFSYSLLPHGGDWKEANVPGRAYEFNIPLEAVPLKGGTAPAPAPYAAVTEPNIILETVKGALHGEGTILRLYECFGKRTNTTLKLGFESKSAVYTSLMEDDEGQAEMNGNEISLTFKPYEIITIRVK